MMDTMDPVKDITTNSKWSHDDFYFENDMKELYECMEHAPSGTFLLSKVSNEEYHFPTEFILLVSTDQIVWERLYFRFLMRCITFSPL